ncbi:MAG: prolipoprotein diacylglyceryl transferase [Faecousia sp.]
MYSDTSPITFPGLGIEIDPSQGFTIPGTQFEIKWYGVIIALGVLLAVLYAMRRAKEFGLTGDDILNMLLVGLPCAIVGARLYYVIFEWDRFFGAGIPWYQFLNIREGGLAIYGGVIGASLALILYCGLSKKRRAKMLPSFDIIGLGLLIGQAIGRWGNFFNREAHGGVTDSFLRMGIIENGQLIYVHPTFLYESLWNLIGLALIHFLSKKRKFDGQVFLYYIIWYGLGRAWIEGLRTDSLYWGPFRVSQVLAAVSCLLAVGVLLYVLLVKRPDPANMLVNRAAASAGEPAPEETSEE